MPTTAIVAPTAPPGRRLRGVSAVAIPILPSRDFDETAAFWALLGFTERGRWPDEYLIQRHPSLGIELHFWYSPRVDRWTNDVACYVRFDSPAATLACHHGWRDIVSATGRAQHAAPDAVGRGRFPRDRPARQPRADRRLPARGRRRRLRAGCRLVRLAETGCVSLLA